MVQRKSSDSARKPASPRPHREPQYGAKALLGRGTVLVRRIGGAASVLPSGTVLSALIAVGVVAGVVLAASLPGPSSRISIEPNLVSADYFANQNVRDGFDRTVEVGLGHAYTGGAWSAWADDDFSVAGGNATVAGVKPGRSVHASLGSTSMRDETLQAKFTVPTLPTAGNGTYVGLEFRRQVSGDAYRARVQVARGGVLRLSVTKVIGGAERVLGSTVQLPGKVAAGQRLVVQAGVTGSATTTVVARAWQAGLSVPAWELKHSDTAPGALASAGAVGLAIYQSTGSSSAALVVNSFDGWSAEVAPTVPVTTSSSTPAGPSTTAAAPSTSGSSTPATSPSSRTTSVTASTSPAPTTSPSTSGSPAPPDPNRTGSDAPAGSAPVGTTAYAPPSDAIYVSVANGNDASGTGSVSSPVRTLSEAIRRAVAGSKIVLRAGTYHEDVFVPARKSITIQSYPHEAVWLDGSSSVADWQTTSTSGVWEHDNWTAKFDSTPGYDSKSAKQYPWVNPAYPMAAHPDQVWITNTALRQVGSLAQVTAGTFYVDYSTSKLYVGSNPIHHDVRASDLSQALVVSSPDTVVRGIGVRRYATSLPMQGTVRMFGGGAHLANIVIKDSASTGLDMSADDGVANHLTVLRNGLLGIRSTHAYHSVITKSVIAQNNNQNFNYGPVAGGIKTTTTRDITLTDNVLSNNYANAVWFDQSSYDMTLTGNSITNNLARGIVLEISSNATILDNTITGNGHQAIFVEDTGNVSIWNNDIENNLNGIVVHQDTRKNTKSAGGHDPRRPNPDPSVPWVAKNVVIGNNVLAASWPDLTFVTDATGARTAVQMNVKLDGNLFDKVTDPSYAEIGWMTSPRHYVRLTAAQFTSAGYGGTYNRDVSSIGRSFSSASKVARPVALPSSLALLIGQVAGVRHIGTF